MGCGNTPAGMYGIWKYTSRDVWGVEMHQQGCIEYGNTPAGMYGVHQQECMGCGNTPAGMYGVWKYTSRDVWGMEIH